MGEEMEGEMCVDSQLSDTKNGPTTAMQLTRGRVREGRREGGRERGREGGKELNPSCLTYPWERCRTWRE